MRKEVTQLIKRQIGSQAECKRQNNRVEQVPIWYNMDQLNCTKVIGTSNGRGTSPGQRIGNNINVKRCVLGVTYCVTPGYVNEQLVSFGTYFDTYIFSVKGKDDYIAAPMTSTDILNFLWSSNGSTAYTGGPCDWFRPHYEDAITLHYKERILMNSANLAERITANNAANCCAYRRFDITKYLPKQLNYAQGADIYPTNMAVYIVVVCTSADAPVQAPYPINTQVGMFNVNQELTYTDE